MYYAEWFKGRKTKEEEQALVKALYDHLGRDTDLYYRDIDFEALTLEDTREEEASMILFYNGKQYAAILLDGTILTTMEQVEKAWGWTDEEIEAIARIRAGR